MKALGAPLKRMSYGLMVLFALVGFVSVSLPPLAVSAQSTPSGPVKIVIVKYSNVLGASTDIVSSLNGYIQEEARLDSIQAGIYNVDDEGFESLKTAPGVKYVFNDIIFEDFLPSPIESIGADPITGVFSDATTVIDYDGSGHAVAVMDSGIDTTHDEYSGGRVTSEFCHSYTLAPSNIQSACPGGVDFSDAVGAGLDCPLTVEGCNGHGTYVAGAVGMLPRLFDVDGDFSSELFGGSATGVDLVAIRARLQGTDPSVCGAGISLCDFTTLSVILTALDHLVDDYAGTPLAAVNMSFGFPAVKANTYISCQANADSSIGVGAYELMQDSFGRLRSAGIAPVVAAGNDGADPGDEDLISFPACVEGAIAVGATNNAGDTIATYSNNGPLTTLLAPGGDQNADPNGGYVLPLTESTSSYSAVQGTSFAAPVVSGAYAVLREKHPDATVDQLTELMQTTGNDTADGRVGYTVGAKKLLQLGSALSTSTKPVIDTFTGPAGTVNENGDVAFTVATTDAASCSLDNGIGSVDTSGTITVSAHANYTLTCIGDFNDTTTAGFTPVTFNSAPISPASVVSPEASLNSEARTALISWAASTDSDGIEEYRVFLDGVLAGTSTETSYTFEDLAVGLEYVATVYAVDTLGAVSLASAPQSFVLAATTAATVPDTGLQSAFNNVADNMALSLGAMLSTGSLMFVGRRFF